MLILHKTIPFNLAVWAIVLLWTTVARAEKVEYDGLIEPLLFVEVGAPTEGIVSEVFVDRSSVVEKGEILVKLESSVERVAVEKARAMVTFDGEIKLQKAQLAFSKRVLDRVKPLAAISIQDKDLAATEIRLTQHRLEKARENHLLAKFELKKAKALLAQHLISSPISGVVVERYVSPGEYINNQPLLRVAQINPLRVEVIVPARMFGRILPGMTATIVPELPAYGEKSATVSIVDKVIDAASNTFGVRLELPNPGLELPAGLRCRVRFEAEAASDGVEGGRGEVQAEGGGVEEGREKEDKMAVIPPIW